MDEYVQSLVQRLGHTISSALSESAEIADIIYEIKQAGYIPILTVEAHIGLISEEKEKDKESSSEEVVHTADKEFLKGLGISLDDPET